MTSRGNTGTVPCVSAREKFHHWVIFSPGMESTEQPFQAWRVEAVTLQGFPFWLKSHIGKAENTTGRCSPPEGRRKSTEREMLMARDCLNKEPQVQPCHSHPQLSILDPSRKLQLLSAGMAKLQGRVGMVLFQKQTKTQIPSTKKLCC